MFKYKIIWRLDDEEYFATEDMEVEAQNVISLTDAISGIEKDHTIISIENLNLR